MKNDLVSIMRKHAQVIPDKCAYIFLRDGEIEQEHISFAELDQKATMVANFLQNKKLAGERILLLYPAGIEFLIAFIACLYAQAIAVPLPCPEKFNWQKTKSIIDVVCEDAGINTIFANAETIKLFEQLATTKNSDQFNFVDMQAIGQSDSNKKPYANTVTNNAITHLQYTSGSTAKPKGVITTHANLIYSLKYTAAAWEYSADSAMINWAPHTHVYGLVCGLLLSLYAGSCTIFMSPASFITKPIRWLNALAKYRATHSGCPNFGYELCLKYIKPEQLKGIDLSSWRFAINGGEQVQANTILNFIEMMAPYGFKSKTMCPAYGMSEITGLISSKRINDEIDFYQLEKSALHRNKAMRSRHEDARLIVGCGEPIQGLEAAIFDATTQQKLGDNQIGEIGLAGPTVSRGYWNLPKSLEHMEFFRTGDLGFIDQQKIYITGRLKEIIIIHGKNYYPLDLEKSAVNSHPILTSHDNVAFSFELQNKEELILVQEISEDLTENDYFSIIMSIRRELSNAYGIEVFGVLLTSPGSIPKTSSGKKQRNLSREYFLNKKFNVIYQNVKEFKLVEGGSP